MRKHLTLAACSLLALGGLTSPTVAMADTVTFSGTMSDSCTVTATGGGTMTAAANGLSMSTEESGGSAAALSVSAVGSPPQVAFTAAGVTSAPSGYTDTPVAGDQVQLGRRVRPVDLHDRHEQLAAHRTDRHLCRQR